MQILRRIRKIISGDWGGVETWLLRQFTHVGWLIMWLQANCVFLFPFKKHFSGM
jgi:hypothetical protein